MDVDSAEELYLSARYPCTALLVKVRGHCRDHWLLEEALIELCEELRSILRSAGRDRVSKPFNPKLLEESVGSLMGECKKGAKRLASTGSKAGSKLLAALEKISRCIRRA